MLRLLCLLLLCLYFGSPLYAAVTVDDEGVADISVIGNTDDTGGNSVKNRQKRQQPKNGRERKNDKQSDTVSDQDTGDADVDVQLDELDEGQDIIGWNPNTPAYEVSSLKDVENVHGQLVFYGTEPGNQAVRQNGEQRKQSGDRLERISQDRKVLITASLFWISLLILIITMVIQVWIRPKKEK